MSDKYRTWDAKMYRAAIVDRDKRIEELEEAMRVIYHFQGGTAAGKYITARQVIRDVLPDVDPEAALDEEVWGE